MHTQLDAFQLICYTCIIFYVSLLDLHRKAGVYLPIILTLDYMAQSFSLLNIRLNISKHAVIS